MLALTHLDLSGLLLEPEAFAGIAAIPGLKYLGLAFMVQEDPKRYAALAKSATLDDLALQDCAISASAALDWIASLESLRVVLIARCKGAAGCLAALASCKALSEVTLMSMSFPGPADARALGAAPALQKVTLYDIGFGDDAMPELAGSPSITSLEMEAVDKVSDSGLAALGALGQLKALLLHRMKRISKKGVAALQAAIPNCEIKADSNLPAEMLAEWMPLPAVRWARVTRASEVAGLASLDEETDAISFSVPFTEKDIAKIKDRAITHIELIDGADADACVEALASLESVRSLKVTSGKASDAMFKAASRLPNLQFLAILTNGDFSDSGVKHLAKLKGLLTVNIYSGPDAKGELGSLKLTNAAVKTLAGIATLRSLRVGDSPKITGKCLAGLDATCQLQDLALVSVGAVSAADLKRLADLKALRSLLLMYESLDDASLKEVAALTMVSELWLAYSDKVTDAGILVLADAPALKDLFVQRCPKVTKAGGAALQQKKSGLRVTMK